MKVIAEYFYENGVEMQQHDIVYLEGEDTENGVWFEGVCRLGFVNNEFLMVYPLGHSIRSNHAINMHIPEIIILIKLDSEEIDKALNKQMKKYIGDRDRE